MNWLSFPQVKTKIQASAIGVLSVRMFSWGLGSLSQFLNLKPSGTFTVFAWEKLPDDIDYHVFVTGDIKVIRREILTENYGKKYPSDHFPMFVEVKFLLFKVHWLKFNI